jgi:chromosome transmission fidelity protein 4
MPRFRLPMRATWARVLNTNTLTQRERKDELYWPFAVTGETFRCIVL